MGVIKGVQSVKPTLNYSVKQPFSTAAAEVGFSPKRLIPKLPA
jgi:hypothetical protein